MSLDDKLLDRIAELLVEQIPTVVKAAGISDEIFSVVLCVANQNPFPPMLGIGSVADRDRIVKQIDEPEYFIWNPEEYTHHLVDELVQCCDELKSLSNQANDAIHEVLDSDDDDVDFGVLGVPCELYKRVSAQLAEYDWSEILNISDDFVVVTASVYECEDVGENMKSSVSPQLRAYYLKQGWILE